MTPDDKYPLAHRVGRLRLAEYARQQGETGTVYPPRTPSERAARSRAADEHSLRAFAAEIWREGFDAGERDVWQHERTSFDEPCIKNPYEETA